MASLASLFNWFGNDSTTPQLPVIWELSVDQTTFVKSDVITLYKRILTDVLERTNGLDDKKQSVLWDNCVKSDSTDGLVSHLAKAMTDKAELFLVYEGGTINVLRKATSEETTIIKESFAKTGEAKLGDNKIGVYISFKKFDQADMVALCSSLEYATIASLYKNMNLSKAIQMKFFELRSSIAKLDGSKALEQGVIMATALREGRDIMLDSEDVVETAKPDLAATEKSEEFTNKRLSKYTNLPEAYFTGEQTGGLGTTGENDKAAIERGLKGYFMPIIKPVIKAIFGIDVTYKSQDFRQYGQANETLKVFSLTDEQFITTENKKAILEGMYNVDPEKNKDTKEPEVIDASKPGVGQNVPPVPGAKAE